MRSGTPCKCTLRTPSPHAPPKHAPTNCVRFCSRCDKCHEPLGPKAATVNGLKLHLGCVRCFECDMSLSQQGSKMFVLEGRLLCDDDMRRVMAPRCKRCSEPVMDSALRLNGDTYHAACLTCALCRISLTAPGASAIARFGDVYCRQCFPLAVDPLAPPAPAPAPLPQAAAPQAPVAPAAPPPNLGLKRPVLSAESAALAKSVTATRSQFALLLEVERNEADGDQLQSPSGSTLPAAAGEQSQPSPTVRPVVRALGSPSLSSSAATAAPSPKAGMLPPTSFGSAPAATAPAAAAAALPASVAPPPSLAKPPPGLLAKRAPPKAAPSIAQQIAQEREREELERVLNSESAAVRVAVDRMAAVNPTAAALALGSGAPPASS